MVTFCDHMNKSVTKRCRVYDYDGVEYFLPLGNYSMAVRVTAEKEA